MGKPARVNGPYPERGKWRIYLIDGSDRKAFLSATRAEAEAMKATLTARAQALSERTIGDTLDAYRDYRVRVRGVLAKTADDHCRHLRALLPVEDALSTLTAERAGRLYRDYTERANHYTGKPIAVATHQWVLLIAKCWGRWLVKAGIVAQNPFSAVEPIGRRSTGKAQLTRDEAQRLSRVAVQKAQAGDIAAVGVLLMLHIGLRQGEVTSRIARDVDHEGRVLIIPFGKTATSRRRLKVPQWLQPYVSRLTDGKAAGDLLFSADGRKLRPHQYWWRKVHEICDAANVPRVCPHSLRGLHATLAIEEGTSGEAVARALGHTSFEITAKHYATPDSVANARLEKASQSLAPSPAPTPTARLDQLLASLTAEELAALRKRLVA
ncbi:MAG: tyrosine-type recombinase/integrase [Myxococcales bacterium]|nr:tyrosine-type recombinase/integrase [Myxococcales bacterium]